MLYPYIRSERCELDHISPTSAVNGKKTPLAATLVRFGTEVRGQRSEVGGQRSEVRGQASVVASLLG
jgi:hypothetical protein